MQRRRVVFRLGVAYQTSVAKLKSSTAIIRKIIESRSDTSFDRSHFATYGDYSLVLETVYFVLSNDYNKHMDIQEAVNLGILEAFAKEGIEFAYPTQLVYQETRTA